MRGFPLFHTGLMVIALAVLAWPLIILTRPASSVQAAPVQQSEVSLAAHIPVRLDARWAHVPEYLLVSHLGEPLWEAASLSALQAGLDATLSIPEEGVDLEVTVRWPEGTPTSALQLTVTPEALPAQDQVLWGTVDESDVLTYQWK